MATDDKRYDEGNREGNPGTFNPKDIDFEHPAKMENCLLREVPLLTL